MSSSKLSREFFRIDKPYGCYLNEEKKIAYAFNREYACIGYTGKNWCSPPTITTTRYFYNDGTKPWESKKLLAKYEIEIQKIKNEGYTIDMGDWRIKKIQV